MKKLTAYEFRGQGGFTLIELLTVIVILIVLAAIAIPVYLDQRKKAWDASVKSDLYNAAIAQATYYGDNGVYTAQVSDLDAKGYNQSNNITISIPVSGASYCMEAYHAGDPSKIWNVRTGDGEPNPQVGPCS